MRPTTPKGFAAPKRFGSGQKMAARLGRAMAGRPAVSKAEERRLLSAARTGDPRATEAMLESLALTIYRFGMSFCRDPHQAEDLTQDVLRTLLAWLPQFRGDSSLSTWAFTVARRACVRRRRRAQRMTSLEARTDLKSHPDTAAGPAETMERRELAGAIQAAIAALPPVQREVVLLRDVEGLPALEVARVLGIGERAVKSRLHRARLALRESLAPHAAPSRIRPVHPSGGPASRCPDTALLLSRYLEGELDGSVCDRLAAHVAGCAACGVACDSLREVLGACRTWGTAPIPKAEQQRVRVAVRAAVEAMAD